MKVSVLLVALAAVAVGATSTAIGQDWGEYEPEWQYACWDASDGFPSSEYTPTGFCVRSNHLCKEIGGPIPGEHCAVMDGWCVKVKSKLKISPGDLSIRCHPATRGELNSLANGHPAKAEWLHACFDERGKPIPDLKPDGFCSIISSTNRSKSCMEHDCGENGSECVSVSERVCSCVQQQQQQRNHSCYHLSAAELAATVRGWPIPL